MIRFLTHLNLSRCYATAFILVQLLTSHAEGDSLSTPLRRQSVCHWHTYLLLLWKVLFPCWVDNYLTVKKICQAHMPFNDIRAKYRTCLCISVLIFRRGPVSVHSWNWNWYQSGCHLSQTHLMCCHINRVLVAWRVWGLWDNEALGYTIL